MKEYRVLIVTDLLYPNMSANSEIAYQIGRELIEKHNCSVTVLGFYLDKPSKPEATEDGFKTISLFRFREADPNYSNRVKKYISFLLHPAESQLIWRIRTKVYNKKIRLFEYKYALKKELADQEYDCIIAYTLPKEAVIATITICMQTPIIVYKLDPWSSRYHVQNRNRELNNERKVDSSAAAIIMNDLILNDYPEKTPQEIHKKINVLKFPKIIDHRERTACNKLLSCSGINCVFTGALYNTVRNPRYSLELFKGLINSEILFHIIGFYYGSINLLESLPVNVIYHGRVSSEESLAYMQSADILVNIGNTELNLLPSKILTYISLGKPILNIIKDPNCPTLPYMEKYPLALNVLETPEPTEEDIARVRDFILTNKGKQIPFETIKEIYYDCTPEYVGGKVYEIIEKVVEENKVKTNKKKKSKTKEKQ